MRPGRELLSGTVEVDETYIGGEEAGLAGGRAKGKKALVAVEVRPPKGFGRCRMQIIPDASGRTLHEYITDPNHLCKSGQGTPNCADRGSDGRGGGCGERAAEA